MKKPLFLQSVCSIGVYGVVQEAGFNSSLLDIYRKNGENIVILSLDEYNALKETDYLLSSENNRKRLLSSLSASRASQDR